MGNIYDTVTLERIATALERIADAIVANETAPVNVGEPKPDFMNIPVKETIDIEKLLTEKDVTWHDSLLDSTRIVFSKVPFTKEEKEVLTRMWRASGYTGFIQFFVR